MADSPSRTEKPAAKPASSSFRGRRKWRKPKDKPKPPLSAYDIFVQQHIALMQRNPSAMDSQRISVMWKSLNAEARSIYEWEAKKDQERFAKEIEEWQNRKFRLAEEEVEDTTVGKRDSISQVSAASIWSAPTGKQQQFSADRDALSQHIASCAHNKWTHVALTTPTTPTAFEEQTEAQTEEKQLQYDAGIELWRKRKFQLSSAVMMEDQRDSLSSAFSSIPKVTTNESPGHDRPTEGITASWNATTAENYTSNSSHTTHDDATTERASLAKKSPRLKSKVPKPAPLPSRPTESPRLAGTSGLLLAAASARHDLSSEQVEKYIRPESLTQLVAQLEHEEVEFLASLRHAS